jgi:hypothetical protein
MVALGCNHRTVKAMSEVHSYSKNILEGCDMCARDHTRRAITVVAVERHLGRQGALPLIRSDRVARTPRIPAARATGRFSSCRISSRMNSPGCVGAHAHLGDRFAHQWSSSRCKAAESHPRCCGVPSTSR